MQNIIYSAFRSAGSLCIVLIIGILLMAGCENPGSVGSDLSEGGADVVIDTFRVDGISTSEYEWYSGAYNYFSAGSFDDPLFGSLHAVGMLKPQLVNLADSIGGLGPNTIAKLRLILDEEQIYGDLSSAQTFNIYEINELWRGRAWKLQDEVQFNTATEVGSFTVSDQDSLVDIPLSTAWLNNYREFVQDSSADADSAYKYETFGLALVPENSGKIIPFSGSSHFILETADDTIDVSLAQWAYGLDRGTGGSIPQNSMPLHSTYESVLNFDLDPKEMNVEGVGISKAELVFYANDGAMESSIPASAERAFAATAQLYIVDPESTPESIALGSPVATGRYSQDDHAYHFTVTSIVQNVLLNDLSENQKFYITFPNNGMIKSSLIYGDQAPADKRPKLIITSLKNNS